jgi:hypothetical protein
VRLYRFGSAADAQNFFRSDIDASSRNTPAADQSGVSNVPGARAFADPKPDSGGYITVIAIGVKGDVVFLVDIAEHSNTVRLGTPDRLMREQYSSARSLCWDACPLADHEPGRGHKAGCGEKVHRAGRVRAARWIVSPRMRLRLRCCRGEPQSRPQRNGQLLL